MHAGGGMIYDVGQNLVFLRSAVTALPSRISIT